MRTAKAQISLRICIVWSGPSLPANRIIWYYKIHEWTAKSQMILCACGGLSEFAHFAHARRHIFARRGPHNVSNVPCKGIPISTMIANPHGVPDYLRGASRPNVLTTKNNRAATCENVSSDLCALQRFKSACASAQFDQSLFCPHEETLHPWLSKMRPVKILIRLRKCADWSESLLCAHVRRYVFPDVPFQFVHFLQFMPI